MASGRTGDPDAKVFSHIAFRLESLPDLRWRYDALRVAVGVHDIDPINHCSWLSVYFRDPENNRMEFFVDTPWYVDQPIVDPLDMALSDDDLLRVTEATYGSRPSFRPMAEWKAEAVNRLQKLRQDA